jgi:hypothetical protein
MKILAAVMDVTRLKFSRRDFTVKRQTKKCLVYDPSKVVIRKVDDARSKQNR